MIYSQIQSFYVNSIFFKDTNNFDKNASKEEEQKPSGQPAFFRIFPQENSAGGRYKIHI